MRDRLQKGLTVVDLLVTLAIVTILAAAVLPSALDQMRTYRRTMATRQILAEIRKVQALSVSRTDVFALEWGPVAARGPAQYRIVRDLTGKCTLPADDAVPDDTDVIRGWFDLSRDYPEVSISSVRDAQGRNLGRVMFDAMGSSINSCGSVSFPVFLTIADGLGGTDVIEVRKSGLARRS